jgi:hypothetical protein
MTTPRDPEALLSAYLTGGMEVLPDRVVDAVLDEIHRTRQGAVFGPRRTRSMSWTGFAAVVVVAAVALSGALFVIQRGLPPVVGPSQTPSPDPSASQAAVTSPSATPSPTPTPILWTVASLAEDWPAPVRAEPDGGAPVESIVVKRIPVDSESCCLADEPGRSIDPTGDIGSDAFPWLDISEVTVRFYSVTIKLASNETPDVGPTEQWIAYGVVFDDDRDGVPDRRFGIDNVQVDPEHGHRTWMTDLHTGRTLVSDGAHIGGAFIDTSTPRNLRGTAVFSFGGDTPRGPMGMELDNRPFYVWASVIQDGRVMATDYAPDVGWLKPSVQTKP